ncbi:MAG: hypothetical protein U0930_12340 [Pirellulales bacterium]
MKVNADDTDNSIVTSESDLLRMYQGAEKGARKAFGAGTVVHTPESIAADVLTGYLLHGIPIHNPFGFGKKAGYRKAMSALRAESTHRKHLAAFSEMNCEQRLSSQSLATVEDKERLLANILSLTFQDAIYLLGRYYLNMTSGQIGALYAYRDNRKVEEDTQRKRLSKARAALSKLLQLYDRES